jgi:hypothetical protein
LTSRFDHPVRLAGAALRGPRPLHCLIRHRSDLPVGPAERPCRQAPLAGPSGGRGPCDSDGGGGGGWPAPGPENRPGAGRPNLKERQEQLSGLLGPGRLSRRKLARNSDRVRARPPRPRAGRRHRDRRMVCAVRHPSPSLRRCEFKFKFRTADGFEFKFRRRTATVFQPEWVSSESLRQPHPTRSPASRTGTADHRQPPPPRQRGRQDTHGLPEPLPRRRPAAAYESCCTGAARRPGPAADLKTGQDDDSWRVCLLVPQDRHLFAAVSRTKQAQSNEQEIKAQTVTVTVTAAMTRRP